MLSITGSHDIKESVIIQYHRFVGSRRSGFFTPGLTTGTIILGDCCLKNFLSVMKKFFVFQLFESGNI